MRQHIATNYYTRNRNHHDYYTRTESYTIQTPGMFSMMSYDQANMNHGQKASEKYKARHDKMLENKKLMERMRMDKKEAAEKKKEAVQKARMMMDDARTARSVCNETKMKEAQCKRQKELTRISEQAAWKAKRALAIAAAQKDKKRFPSSDHWYLNLAPAKRALPPSPLLERLCSDPFLLVATSASRQVNAAISRAVAKTQRIVKAIHMGSGAVTRAALRRAMRIEALRAKVDAHNTSASQRAVAFLILRAARGAHVNYMVLKAASRRLNNRLDKARIEFASSLLQILSNRRFPPSHVGRLSASSSKKTR